MVKTKKMMRGLYIDEKIWKTIDDFAGSIDRSTNWLAGEIIKQWAENSTTHQIRKTKRAPLKAKTRKTRAQNLNKVGG